MQIQSGYPYSFYHGLKIQSNVTNNIPTASRDIVQTSNLMYVIQEVLRSYRYPNSLYSLLLKFVEIRALVMFSRTWSLGIIQHSEKKEHAAWTKKPNSPIRRTRSTNQHRAGANHNQRHRKHQHPQLPSSRSRIHHQLCEPQLPHARMPRRPHILLVPLHHHREPPHPAQPRQRTNPRTHARGNLERKQDERRGQRGPLVKPQPLFPLPPVQPHGEPVPVAHQLEFTNFQETREFEHGRRLGCGAR